jgi:DNA-binding CsgD family transcriptional regulator
MRSETEAVSHLIGDIYDASINPEKWRPVLQEVCAFVKAGFAILISEDAISSKALVHYSSEDDAEWLDSYFRKYIRLNPMLIPMLNSRVGDIFSMSNIMTHKQFRSTVFFKEWVEPRGYIDTIGAVLDKSATGISVVSAVRLKQQGVVDAGARRRMALIAPHVQRAVAIGRVVDLSYLEASAMSDTLDGFSAAIFLVDGRGNIAFANESGRALLATGGPLRQSGRTLTATDPIAGAALSDAFAASAVGDAAVGTKGLAIPLSGKSAERYIAYVLPLTSGARKRAGAAYGVVAALFVRKMEMEYPSPLETICQIYDLTARELSVFLAVVEVGGIPPVSALLGLSETTVKTYLKAVFRKTGTTRQADLAKIVAGLANPFASGKPGSSEDRS